MKKIILALALLSLSFANAQVAIGKQAISSTDVSLEFYDSADNAKGIVLPWVSTVANSPVAYNATTGAGYNGMSGTVVDGTLILDLSDSKVKYRKDGTWSDLTGSITFPLVVKNAANQDVTITAFSTIDSSLQDSVMEKSNAKAAIGADGATDSTAGILVLTDTNKAMVLPKVASPHLTIQDPAPGMIAYDTVKKQLAVYNGTLWSFWKP